MADNIALRAEIDAAIARVLDSGRFIGGPEVAAFEHALAEAAGAPFAVAVSSGTDALLASLIALGVGPGDEVVTTPFSFFATAEVICRVGAVPVFADIDPETLNLDPVRARAVMGPRTRAVIPVHLFGLPATLPECPPGVAILEDAAQALGAAPVRGAAAAVSFFPAKVIGGIGDGGAVLTGDAALAETLRELRVHGARERDVHARIGGNFRLDAIHAAVLAVKLPHLGRRIAARRAIAARYRAGLGGLPAVRLPPEAAGHIYSQFVIRTADRDGLRAHLRRAGIDTAIYYPRPIHLQPCMAGLGHERGAFPEAERAAGEVLALPIYPELGPGDQAFIIATIADFFARAAP